MYFVNAKVRFKHKTFETISKHQISKSGFVRVKTLLLIFVLFRSIDTGYRRFTTSATKLQYTTSLRAVKSSAIDRPLDSLASSKEINYEVFSKLARCPDFAHTLSTADVSWQSPEIINKR